MWEVRYAIMTPKRAEVTNLLVPVCNSASHVIYGSIRVEPTFVSIGQAAGAAGMTRWTQTHTQLHTSGTHRATATEFTVGSRTLNTHASTNALHLHTARVCMLAVCCLSAAYLAVRDGVAVQDVNITELQDLQRQHGVEPHYPPGRCPA